MATPDRILAPWMARVVRSSAGPSARDNESLPSLADAVPSDFGCPSHDLGIAFGQCTCEPEDAEALANLPYEEVDQPELEYTDREADWLEAEANREAEAAWADRALESDARAAEWSPRTPCWKCSGTGEYVWGAIVNGVPSRRGMCFSCRGKGYQTPADVARTDVYYNEFYTLRS